MKNINRTFTNPLLSAPKLLMTLMISAAIGHPQAIASSRENSQPLPLQIARQVTKSPTATPRSARDYYNRAMRRYRSQDRSGAIADFNRAIELEPNFVDAYNNRGIIRGASGDNLGAIGDYTRAIALNPKFFEAYANRGFARLSTGDKIGAMADLQTASEIKPNDPQLACGATPAKRRWR